MHDYSQSGDHSARMMTGFMFGAVVGAGIALLLAPATGEETRRRLKESASRLRDNADDAMNQVKERFDEARHGVQDMAREAREGVKGEYSGTGTNPGAARSNPIPGSRPA